MRTEYATFSFVDDDERDPTTQERDMMRLLAAGLNAESVARQLSISERTLRRRMRYLCVRFGVNSPMEAIVTAVRRGWI